MSNYKIDPIWTVAVENLFPPDKASHLQNYPNLVNDEDWDEIDIEIARLQRQATEFLDGFGSVVINPEKNWHQFSWGLSEPERTRIETSGYQTGQHNGRMFVQWCRDNPDKSADFFIHTEEA